MGFVQLFLTDQFQRDFNCSFYNVDSIPLSERVHLGSGIALGVMGIVFELLNVLCVYALSRKHVRETSFCFELMLMMCTYDLLTLPITASLTSYLAIAGSMYCSHPYIILTFGLLGHGLWMGYSHVSIILAINRCLVFTPYEKMIFNENTRILWLAYPMCLTIGIWLFVAPTIYNGVYASWFFNPHLSYFPDETGKYNSWFQFYNNIFFCTLIPVIYVVFGVLYKKLAAKSNANVKKEIGLFIQIFLVNMTIVSSAAGYTIMQVVDTPAYIVHLTHLAWVVVEGSPAMIYLSINKTVKTVLFTDFKWLRVIKAKVANGTVSLPTRANPPPTPQQSVRN